jgi:hypothetical protein
MGRLHFFVPLDRPDYNTPEPEEHGEQEVDENEIIHGSVAE